MGVIRRTKSVKVLLKSFEHCNTAISTIELVERFADQMNKSTVYRILERLEDEGTLHSFIGKDGLRWYAAGYSLHTDNVNVHPHFQCSECGKTECLPIHIPIPEITKYTIESASFLLMGTRKNCTP